MRAKKENELWSSYIAENRDEIMDEMERLAEARYPYQVDLYVWEDGELGWFHNPGGSSWMECGIDHIIAFSANYELVAEDEEPYDWECLENALDVRIESLLLDEAFAGELF